MEKKKRTYKHRPYTAVATLTKITDEQKNKIIELYTQGSSQTFIEKTLGMTRKTIRTVLKQNGIDRDKSSQWRLRYKSSLNEKVFDDLNPESLYWIGFLYADGHIRKHKEYSIELEIELKDMEHLKKYTNFLDCNKEIKVFDNSCKIKVYSQILHEKLKTLGFRHDKSYTAKPHELLKNDRNFWRGVVDGDGGIYLKGDSYKTNQITLCGTLETIFDFIIFCSKFAGINDKYPSQCKGKNLYQVHYYGEDAVKVSTLLYRDSTIHLDRKYEQYKQLII